MSGSARRPLLAYGAGSPDIVKLVAAINRVRPTWELVGFIDDTPEKAGTVCAGVPVLGSHARLADYDPATTSVYNNVAGSIAGRRAVTRRLHELGWRLATLVHPTVDDFGCEIGEGSSIGAFVSLGIEVRVGVATVIRPQATIGHETRVGEHAFIGPGVMVAGRAVVEAGAFLGMGCIIRNDVTVGADAVVGAGAVVIADVPPGARVGGVPAQPLPPPRTR